MSVPHANGNGSMPRTPWNSTGDLATTGLNFRSYDSVLALTGRKAGRHVNTGLVCTLGPSCADVDTLCDMLKSGMNIARFNFSHGSIESQQKMLDMLNEAKQRTGIMCAVAMDTKGPEIRTGNLENGEAVFLTSGQDVLLTTDYSTVGNSKVLAVSYPNLAKEINIGDKVLIADGSLTLAVMNTEPEEGKIFCRAENSAKVGEKKNVNVPGVDVDLPILTENDEKALDGWALKNQIDFIFASFVQYPTDIHAIRTKLGEDGKYIRIISKIESVIGIRNFDSILKETDGVMVARGDLGMEIPIETTFIAQKKMIRECNIAAKPVITATQMLESMIANPRPTRAEVTDVANAVLDGTDCVMLSGETAGGKFPLEAVRTLGHICREAETMINHDAWFREMINSTKQPMSIKESLASSAVRTAAKVNAALIVVLAANGTTARLLSKYKPSCPVLCAVVPKSTGLRSLIGFESMQASNQVARQLMCTSGIEPLVITTNADADILRARFAQDSAVDAVLREGILKGVSKGYCGPNDMVVAMHSIGEEPRAIPVIKIVPVDFALSPEKRMSR